MRKLLTIILTTILLFIITVTILYRSLYREHKTLNNEIRKNTTGSYAELESGITHYELSGDSSAPVVVLIHGGGPPMWVWDRQINALHEAGFRTLRFDRYGTGYSDRLDTTFSWRLLSNQVKELLEYLDIKGPVHITGRSIGGRVAACFAVEHPELTKSLTVVSHSLLTANHDIGFRIPGMIYVYEFMYRVFGNTILKTQMKKYREYIDSEERIKKYFKSLKEQREFYGTEDNFFAIFRDTRFIECPKAKECLEDTSKPLSIIYGTEDPLVPERRIKKLRKKRPEITYRSIKGAGHGVNFTHHKEFNEILIRFLKRAEE